MNYLEIDNKLDKLSKQINVISALKPTNLNSEKEIFFKDSNYNPQFKYKIKNYSTIKKELKKLEIPLDELGKLFEAKRQEFLKQIELIELIGTNKFTSKSIELYGKPSRKILNLARKDLENIQFEKERNELNTNAIKEILEKRLKELNINWKVELKDSLADIVSVSKDGIIFLRKDILVSKQRIQTMLKHEIDCHVVKANNGLKQKYKIFNYGFPNYLETEEGIAIYMVNQLGLKTKKIYVPQVRVVLVDLALKNSFSKVFAKCLEYGFSKEEAWDIVPRLKRGLKDTSLPGGFTKDYIYYSGYLKVKKYLEKGKLEDLFVGKISLEGLDMINKHKLLKLLR